MTISKYSPGSIRTKIHGPKPVKIKAMTPVNINGYWIRPQAGKIPTENSGSSACINSPWKLLVLFLL